MVECVIHHREGVGCVVHKAPIFNIVHRKGDVTIAIAAQCALPRTKIHAISMGHAMTIGSGIGEAVFLCGKRRGCDAVALRINPLKQEKHRKAILVVSVVLFVEKSRQRIIFIEIEATAQVVERPCRRYVTATPEGRRGHPVRIVINNRVVLTVAIICSRRSVVCPADRRDILRDIEIIRQIDIADIQPHSGRVRTSPTVRRHRNIDVVKSANGSCNRGNRNFVSAEIPVR